MKVKTYSISVEGFGPATYCARSPGKARARAYRDFRVSHDISFKEFLRRSRLLHMPNPPGVGDRIVVAGEPATRVYHPCAGHYVWFMRDGSDEILCSHPADVAPASGASAGALPEEPK